MISPVSQKPLASTVLLPNLAAREAVTALTEADAVPDVILLESRLTQLRADGRVEELTSELETLRRLVTSVEDAVAHASERLERTERPKLVDAALRGSVSCFRSLLEGGAEVDAQTGKGETALFAAAGKGRVEMVQMLVNHGANPCIARSDGATPLFIASNKGHLDIVHILVRHGANLNAPRADGVTPLLIAAEIGRLSVLRYFCESHVKLNALGPSGTALHVAASRGDVPAIESLVAATADLNQQRRDGATALFLATQKGHLRVVEQLCAARADADLASRRGTPLRTALFVGNQEVVRILIAYGAKMKGGFEVPASCQLESADVLQDTLRTLGAWSVCGPVESVSAW